MRLSIMQERADVMGNDKDTEGEELNLGKSEVTHQATRFKRKTSVIETFDFKKIPGTHQIGKAVSLNSKRAGKNFFFTSNSLPYEDNDEINELHISQKHSVSLAVIGGNIFRSVLGISYPKYLLGYDVNATNGEKIYYRFAQEVNAPFKEEWRSIGRNEEVYGIIMCMLTAYFLNETDFYTENITIVKHNDYNVMVRVDPQYSFSEKFGKETVEDILNHLEYLLDPSKFAIPSKNSEVKKGDEESEHQSSDTSSDSGNDSSSDDEDNVCIPEQFAYLFQYPFFKESVSFQKVFNSDQRKEELFLGLALIIGLIDGRPKIVSAQKTEDKSEESSDVISFTTILNEVFLGIDDVNFKNSFEAVLLNKANKFKEAAFKLEGFQQYYTSNRYKPLDEKYETLYKAIIPSFNSQSTVTNGDEGSPSPLRKKARNL